MNPRKPAGLSSPTPHAPGNFRPRRRLLNNPEQVKEGRGGEGGDGADVQPTHRGFPAIGTSQLREPQPCFAAVAVSFHLVTSGRRRAERPPVSRVGEPVEKLSGEFCVVAGARIRSLLRWPRLKKQPTAQEGGGGLSFRCRKAISLKN